MQLVSKVILFSTRRKFCRSSQASVQICRVKKDTFPTSLMKMSLNFKFLYNYFTPLFFEFSGSGVSINASNSVLNFYINEVGSRLLM
jgi:hypothetical protein